MKTTTSHNITLTDAELKHAVLLYLQERGMAVPETASEITVKWMRNGEARILFCLETPEEPEPQKQTQTANAPPAQRSSL